MAATKIGTAASSQAQPTAISRTADGTRNTYKWVGDYSTLVSAGAAYTINLSTIDGLTVRSTDVDPGSGGLATLTVVADNIVPGGNVAETVYELEWVRVDKDIRFHPEWDNGGKLGMGTLLDTDREQIERKLRGDKVTEAISDLGYELYDRLLKGVTSYPIGIPVARQTNFSIVRPSSSGTWVKSSPPSGCGAPSTSPQTGAGYTYVKTADRIIKRNGGFERTQEWSGFEDTDPLLYP